MAVYVAQASCDERGRYTGGQAGNQSGTELNTRAWYPYGWKTVIRFNDPARAAKCAEVAAKAVANMAIGYDQGQRNTILPLAEAAGWNLAKVSKACECDCTSLAAVCAIAAGASKAVMYEGGNLAYTGNMAERMKRAADVSVFTSAAYTGSSAKLQAGDILVSGSHCVIVTSGAAQPSPAAGADIEALAKAVIAGRYGSGEQRKAALGASYEAVQRRVNEMLAGTANAAGTSTGAPRIVAGTYKVICDGLNVREKPTTDSAKVADYSRGGMIYGVSADTDEADGYLWAHYTAKSGKVRYVAVGSLDGSEKFLAKAA